MPFIGVRISWLIVARKLDFPRFAASAVSRVRSSSAVQLGDEGPRIGQLVQHERQQRLVVAAHEHVRRDAPQLREATVGGGHPARTVHHQQAVGRGLDRGLKEGERPMISRIDANPNISAVEGLSIVMMPSRSVR